MNREDVAMDVTVQNVEILRGRLEQAEHCIREVAASLAWNCFGECRAVHDGPIMPAQGALEMARDFLASQNGERNQCDGCQAGIPLVDGAHRMGRQGGYPDLMSCQKERYEHPEQAEGAQADCTCVYATSANTESVRKGYEVGGYLKEECAACKARAALAQPSPVFAKPSLLKDCDVRYAANAQPSPAPDLELPQTVGWFNRDATRESGIWLSRHRVVTERQIDEGALTEPVMTVAQHAGIIAKWADLLNRANDRADAAQARVAELDKQCRDDVARALGLTPQGDGYAWSALLADIKTAAKVAQAGQVPLSLQFVNAVKQLCKDFADRQDRPYMGNVFSALDALLVNEQIPVAQVGKVPDALREAVEYLDSNPFNEIGSGSILHRQMRDAIAGAPAQGGE